MNTWTCEQIEARLSDYLDGLLAPAERATFDAHVPTCERCAPLLASVSHLLTNLHSLEELEPPPRLVYSILDKTLGPRDAVTGWRAALAWIRGLATPKFAYGVVAFAATYLVLSTGFSFRKPRLTDLAPATVYRNADRQAHLVYAKGTKFVNDLRVVSEIQSRLRQDNDMPTSQEGIVPSREKQPGQTDGSKPTSPRQQNRANDLSHQIEILADALPVWAGHLSVPVFAEKMFAVSMVARRQP